MSKLRSLSTAFWSDPFIEDLNSSEKLLFIYLITNEKTNMLGIYESSIKKISFETGIDKIKVTDALKSFEEQGKVKYINNYVILINFLKHQNFNTNMKKSAIDVYNSLPNELKSKDISISKVNTLESFETLLNHFGMVRKVEVESELESKIELESKDENQNTSIGTIEDIPSLKLFIKNKIKLKDLTEELINTIENANDKKYIKVAQGFWELFKNNLEELNMPTISIEKAKIDWADEIRKLHTLDGYHLVDFEDMYKFLQDSSFWKKNIQSVKMFRSKNKQGVMKAQTILLQAKSNQKEKLPTMQEAYKENELLNQSIKDNDFKMGDLKNG